MFGVKLKGLGGIINFIDDVVLIGLFDVSIAFADLFNVFVAEKLLSF